MSYPGINSSKLRKKRVTQTPQKGGFNRPKPFNWTVCRAIHSPKSCFNPKKGLKPPRGGLRAKKGPKRGHLTPKSYKHGLQPRLLGIFDPKNGQKPKICQFTQGTPWVLTKMADFSGDLVLESAKNFQKSMKKGGGWGGGGQNDPFWAKIGSKRPKNPKKGVPVIKGCKKGCYCAQ